MSDRICPPTPADVREARLRLGWSARQLADALGISSPRVVYGWERGESKIMPPSWRLIQLWLANPDTRPAWTASAPRKPRPRRAPRNDPG